jgi:hypothetical protein
VAFALTDRPDQDDAPLDRRVAALAFVAAFIVHGAGLGMLVQATNATMVTVAVEAFDPPSRLCEGRRCPFAEVAFPRRKPDAGPLAELDFIEVTVIPRLGMKAEEPKELPTLVKYEQPEVLEEAINIEAAPKVEEILPKKEPRAKPAEIDKTRPTPTLDDILDVPRDDDPRKRPTKLDNIVGTASGSPFGTELSDQEVDAIIARLQRELQAKFTVPTTLSDAELRALRVKFRIEIDPAGTITSYKVVGASKEGQFNSAAEATLKQFMPAEGGSARLPEIPADLRANINAGKVVFVFDGKYLRR